MRSVCIPLAARVARYHHQRAAHSLLRCSFSDGKKATRPRADNGTIDKSATAPTASSRIRQWANSLTFTASETISKASDRANRAAIDAIEVAASKAKSVTTEATRNIRHSITNAKINAKEKGEQSAWEANRSLTRMGETLKQSAKSTALKTGERVKESLADVATSTARRLKDEAYQRMQPTLSKLPFLKQSTSIEPTQISTLSDTKALSNILPKKEELMKSASNIATETAAKTTTRVEETIHKTTRWLWWWGLAAVGVYGVSTTLTKEGVVILKDIVSLSRDSLTGGGGGGSEGGGSSLPITTPASSAGVAEIKCESAAGNGQEVRDGSKKGIVGWVSSLFFPR